MKRQLSVSPAGWLFLSRQVGGLVGSAVACLALVRVHERLGVAWLFVLAAATIVVIVAILIVNGERSRRTLLQVAAEDRSLQED